MKTTFSYFPGMFGNPAPAVKTSCKLNIIFFKSKIFLIVIICVEFFTIRVKCYNFLNLNGRYVLQYESFFSSDHHR